MTKVLMVGNSPSVKGGITTVIEQFLNHDWKKENISFKFIPTYKDSNVIIKIMFFFFAYIRILFYIFFKKPNIVHIHMSYKGSFTRAKMIHDLCDFFRIKVVVHLHGSEFKSWYDSCDIKKQQKIKKFIKRSYKFIVLGNEWKERVINIEPSVKIVVVNNTVSIPKENTSYSIEKIKFLFLGVLIKRKGVHDLLSAISDIPKEYLKNTEFIIAGSGEEEKSLKEYVEINRLKNYIKFVGWTENEKKVELLKECQCLVLPSYNEGLPMAILEALSYGVPIISTKVGDIPEAVINNYNGFLFDSGDIDALRKILLCFINMNEEQWIQMSQNSKRIVLEKFSSQNYFEKFAEIYKGEC